MARRGWRYFAQRLSGAGGDEPIVDLDLPLEDVSFERVLSAQPTLEATITPAYSRLLGPDGLPILKEWGTAIYAEHDGDIRYGGILVGSEFSGPDWSIDCVGFTGYPQDMPYVGSKFFVETDPLDIVRHIWYHIQAQRGGNIGLEVSTVKSGKKIGTTLKQGEFDTKNGPLEFESGPYKLAWYQDHDLAGNIDSLAEETFDYVESHHWDGDRIRHKLDFGVPQLGRKRDDLRFVFGENIHELPSLARSGEEYATEVMTLGAGEGNKMIKGEAYRQRDESTGLRRVAVVSDTNLRSVRAAQSRSNAEIQWRSQLDDITEVTVVDTPSAPLGAVDVGDIVYLTGRVSEWREVDTQVRILGIKTTPADGNQAVYTVARTDRTAS